MKNGSEELEVKIRSAEDLQDARLLKVGKVLHSYALAWIASSNSLQALHKLSTRPPLHCQAPHLHAADDDNDTLYPTWPPHHSSLRIPIPAATTCKLYLVIRLFGQRSRSPQRMSKSKRVVGTVTIPLADITSSRSHSWQLLSYHVKRPSGRLQGVLNLSVRFSARQTFKAPCLQDVSSSPWAPSAPPLASLNIDR